MNTRRLHFIVSLLLVLGVLTSCGGGGGPAEPNAPANVRAEPLSDGSIRVSWEDRSDNETGFFVYRKAAADDAAEFVQVGETAADVTSFIDENVDSTVQYLYAVAAVNANGESSVVDIAEPVQPNPEAGRARLIVTKVGTGQGVVTSEPEGIECIQRPEVLSDCTEDFPEGTEVTLTAQPDPGSVFAGWGGACSGTGECEVAMGSSKEVEAIFSPPESTLSVSKDGDGGGRVVDVNTGGSYIDCGSDCAFTAPTGTTLVLEAAPNEGSLFAGWEGCSRIRNNGDCEIQVNTNVTVGATFSQPSLTIESFTASPRNVPPGGQVTLSWNVSGNDDFTLSLSNNRDDEVLDVTGQTSVTVNPDETTTYRLTAESAIETKEDTETVTVGDEPQISLFEIVGGDTTIPTGAEVTLRWEVGGAGDIEVTISGIEGTFGPEDSTTIDISEPGTFEFVLTASSEFGTDTSEPVTITVGNPPEIVSFDADPATIVKDEQSSTLAWEVTGAGDITLTLTGGTEDEDVSGTTESTVSPSTTTLYTLTATSAFGSDDADTTVTVEYRLTVTQPENGRITGDGISCGISCTQVFGAGSQVSLQAEPAEGYEFESWGGACSAATDDTCQVTMNNNRTVSVNFEPVNNPPQADAGPDQPEAVVGEPVSLDGTGSSDPDGDNLAYTWEFTSRPNGSSASLADADSATPTFTPDVAGVYDVRLTVSDGEDTDTDTVTVTAVEPNTPPNADAGADQPNAIVGEVVTLNGGNSSDPDGDTLTYSWSFTSRPSGSSATLSGETTQTPTFTPDVEGNYVIQLTVSDGEDTDTDTVTVTATEPNAPPVADAGPNQSDAIVGEVVNLNGSGSSDPDGDSLTYSWAFTSRPDGSSTNLSGANSATPSFIPDVAGGYVVELTVSDGEDADTDTVTVTAANPNTPPNADAGSDQPNATVGQQVFLDGGGSSDPDGDTLSYSWAFTATPGGSSASLSGANTQTPSFTPDVAGEYVVELTVSDGEDSDMDSVTVTAAVANTAPTADAGPNQTDAIVDEEVTLDGTGSSDPDGDSLTFLWEFLSMPSGSAAVLSNATTEMSSFIPDLEGTYDIELTVDDGQATGTDSVSVTAGTVPTIDSFTADPDSIASGSSSTLQWAVTGTGPLSYSIGPDVGDVDGTSVEVLPTSTTEYTLTAENDFGSDTATATVTVGTAPTIDSFTATPASITSGNSSTLEWAVSGTAPISLSINQGVGDVTGASSTSVSPTETTTYTLSAVNDFGQADADVMVSVEPPLP